MSVAEVEASTRQIPSPYERARRRQMKRSGDRDATVAYLTPGQPSDYRLGSQRSERAHEQSWPTVAPAYRYARGQLARLAEQHVEAGLAGPSLVAYHRMLHVLRFVLAEDSVYPTMSIDEDGGIIAEWRILRHALEIDVDPEGEFTYVMRTDGKRVGGGTSQTPLRKLIRDVSVVVGYANPNWRALFQPTSASMAR